MARLYVMFDIVLSRGQHLTDCIISLRKRGTDGETDISLAPGNIISTGLYHDPWAVCIS
jgi:hypothetical protein